MKKILAIVTAVTVLSIGALAFAGSGWFGGMMGSGYGGSMMGSGFSNHMGYGGGMMGYGSGGHMGYGNGGSMMGSGYGNMYGYDGPHDRKSPDETTGQRKELNKEQKSSRATRGFGYGLWQ